MRQANSVEVSGSRLSSKEGMHDASQKNSRRILCEQCLMHYIHVCGSAFRKIARVIKHSTLAI